MGERKPYYGIIGNGETVALVSPQAGIDWLCLPRFDGKIAYAKALDPVNGRSFSMSVLKNNRELLLLDSSQGYIEKTNVLETRLGYKGVSAVVTDFMPWKGISELIEDKRFIFRIVRIRNTSSEDADITIRCSSGIKTDGNGYAEVMDGNVIYSESGFSFGVAISFSGSRKPARRTARSMNIVRAGEEKTAFVILAYDESRAGLERKLRKIKFIDLEEELETAKKFWKNWVERGRKANFGNKDYESMYYRSLLLIKLLTYERTGAILAAPTTSFPATPGGSENWDYRFMWIRDSFFACRALLKAGHTEEVEKQLSLFYRMQGKNGHWPLPFYTIDGKEPGKEIVIEELGGSHGEDVIRINNEAKDQLQLDSEGSVLHLTYLHYLYTKDPEFLRKYWRKIRATADWIVRNYGRRENGLWELREGKHRPLGHWTYGKVMCYAGLGSAIEMADVIRQRSPDSWHIAQKKLRNEIIEFAWSPSRRAFTQTYEDNSQMDISALAIEDYGILSPLHAKVRETVKRMEEKLVTEGDGVKRFEDALIPFYLPTLWLAMHFIRAGELARAKRYIDAALSGSTSLYLCAEHFDPKTGRQHGNFPQTFSAAAFIDALAGLSEAKKFGVLRKINLQFKDMFRSLMEI
jgi:GH15 family glucan-1,4-alpha-glucosidase